MTLDRHLRIVLAIAIVVGMVLLLFAVLMLTESALEVWHRFREAPRWATALWLGALGTLTLATGWAVWRLLFPARQPAREPEALTEEALQERMAQSEQLGIDVDSARQELVGLAQRKAAGDFRIALFGEISAGKSALIRALLPQADDITVSARGGSTRELSDYIWTSPAGDRLIVTDVPGLNEADGLLDQPAKDEALRAHAVVFVCDNDLTRAQHDAVGALRELHRPMIVALNKTDRFTDVELEQLRTSLRQRVEQLGEEQLSVDQDDSIDIVAISAAPLEKIVRQLPDGTEQVETRAVIPEIDELGDALQRMMDRDPVMMEELRDASVFILARRKLDVAEAQYRKERSQELISEYTRKAMVGALAAVAPGTDILIQGYLGANFVRELCELYDVSPRDIDVQQFLKLSQMHIGKALPLLMAIGGNALKAFPGAGTVAGGLMHAVAYGLIFDALGSSLTRTLSESGRLRPAPAASLFRKQLSENLEKRTARVAKLAWDARRKTRD
ncbi:MAG: 50S ribosome-binding GTPase [Gammaproteobacteria bacterium]|nr:50S ribosome-binding GTPase [Gammaproteobacteria bacterium]